MAANTSTDYSSLWAMVKAELSARAAKGEPLRVNLWDANHHSPIPRQIVGDAGLYDAVATVGKPAYVIENVGNVDSYNRMFHDYYGGDEIKRRKIEAILEKSPLSERSKDMLRPLLSASGRGAEVYFPDPRQIPKFTEEEVAMYQRFKKAMQHVDGACVSVSIHAFRNSLSPEDQSIYLSMDKKGAIAAVGGGDEKGNPIDVDKVIAERAIRRFPEQAKIGAAIPITMYGVKHFSGDADLNEMLPGLDIAIFEDAASAQEFYSLSGARQFPHYVWYSNEGRLVKVEGDAIKMELTGAPTAELLHLWERNELPPRPADLPAAIELPPDIAARCAEAVKHLKLYQPESQTVPEGGLVPTVTGQSAGQGARSAQP